MIKKHSTKFIVLIIVVLVAVQLACGASTGTNTGSEEANLQATAQSLQATQDALNSNAQQPTKERPTEIPATEVPPTDVPTQVPTTQAPPTEVPPTAVPTQKTTFSSGDVIYFTDFDGAEDWEDGWIQFATSDMDYRIYKNNGVLRVEVPEPNSGVYAFYDDLYFERDKADVYIETNFENFATHNINNVTLICRATENGWYEFSMLSGGLWQIWKYDANSGYRMINDGGVADLDYDAPHYLSASCIGDTLTIYIDGEKPKNGSIKDSSFREGQVGLSVYAFEWKDVIIEFDYFLVQAP